MRKGGGGEANCYSGYSSSKSGLNEYSIFLPWAQTASLYICFFSFVFRGTCRFGDVLDGGIYKRRYLRWSLSFGNSGLAAVHIMKFILASIHVQVVIRRIA